MQEMCISHVLRQLRFIKDVSGDKIRRPHVLTSFSTLHAQGLRIVNSEFISENYVQNGIMLFENKRTCISHISRHLGFVNHDSINIGIIDNDERDSMTSNRKVNLKRRLCKTMVNFQIISELYLYQLMFLYFRISLGRDKK